MTNKHLHIVTHDVPFPVKHGGFVDIFYKIVSLYEKGVIIYLHCFKKGWEKEQKELNKYCKRVHYYQRKTGFAGVSLNTPYIVNSRKSEELYHQLSNDT